MNRNRAVDKVAQARATSVRHGHDERDDVTANSDIVYQAKIDDIDVRRVELCVLAIA